jgi:hypothetical protein
MELTRKQAFELSIEKWRMIVKNGGKEPDSYPEKIIILFARCGLCEKYLKINFGCNCGNCPIQPTRKGYKKGIKIGCRYMTHPFHVWELNHTKANAQAVLDLILSKQ